MTTIALISSHAPSLALFRAPLIRALRARGIAVYALAPNFDQTTRAAVSALGASPVDFHMSRTGMNPLRDLLDTWKLARLLRQLGPDITLGYFIKPVIYGSLAAWISGVPRRFAMVEGLGFVFTQGQKKPSWKRRLLKMMVTLLYRLGISRTERVIFLNPDDQSELVSAGVLPLNKGFVLGAIGVELAQWPVVPPVISPISFLLVARLLREKGIEEYVAAARMLKQKHPQVRVVLLGGLDDNPGSITREEVQAWVNEGIIEWYGHVPVQPWLAKSSVFVLPSYREGVPVSTQEAMATGRPVITTDVPGCRETVCDGVNGFLVPPYDAAALAQKMLIFINQPHLISVMGQASRRMAEDRFDAHKASQRLVDLVLT